MCIRDRQIGLHAQEVGAQHVGDQLVANDDGGIARGPYLAQGHEERGRQRLHGLRHDGQRQAVRQLVDALVPVVGHEAERDARVARLREPETRVARHLMRVAREDGVVDVEQHEAEAKRQQVALDVDVR